MEILKWVLIFGLGFIVGFLVKVWLIYRVSDYMGTLLVSKKEGKTVYSLVLDDYPEKLEFRKQVIFKIDASEENLDRD